MSRGGKRKNAGRKKEFDGVYPLKYTNPARRAWEGAAAGADLSVWMRSTLNYAAGHKPPPDKH